MGFRNPITSLRADQITPGTLPPGVELPASQVTYAGWYVAGELSALAEGLSTTDGTATAAAAAAADAHNAAVAAQETGDTATAAAAQAIADAAAAQAAAEAAQDTATTALTAANGKNRVTWSTVAPDADGEAAGDVWFRFAGATVIGQWRWDGTDWLPQTIGDQVIANLSAAKIVTGALAAGVVITCGTPGGARVELTESGVRAYAPDGVTVLMDLDAGAARFTGEVIGSLITGGTFRTAAGGQRIELAEDDAQRAAFYTGAVSEWTPGGIEVDVISIGLADTGRLILTAPDTSASGGGGGEVGRVTLRSAASDNSTPSAVELEAGQITLNGHLWQRQRTWGWGRTGTSDTFGASAFVALIGSGNLVNMPPGDYAVSLTLVLSADAAREGNVRLTGPAQLRPLLDPRADMNTQAQPHSFNTTIDNFPGGTLSLAAYARVVAGTGRVFAAGSLLTLAYLGPRT